VSCEELQSIPLFAALLEPRLREIADRCPPAGSRLARSWPAKGIVGRASSSLSGASFEYHSLRTHCTRAIDLPGTTWRDRPAISRSNSLAVATDQSAAPGLLAEAGFTAAQLAVEQLGETARCHS